MIQANTVKRLVLQLVIVLSPVVMSASQKYSEVSCDRGMTVHMVEMTDTLPTEVDTSAMGLIRYLLYSDSIPFADPIEDNGIPWRDALIPPLVDLMAVASADVKFVLLGTLVNHIDIADYTDALYWMWEADPLYEDDYGDIRAEIYQHIDKGFVHYFAGRTETSTVSLDEILWAGKRQSDFPPLKLPPLLTPSEAGQMKAEDVVYGLSVGGEVVAVPLEVLASHESIIQKIGGVNLAIVFCPLSQTVVAYEMNHRSDIHDLASSGFLYRGSKLLRDTKTHSLWSTIDGVPILGPLADRGIRLRSLPLVQTSWATWLDLYPQSKVISTDSKSEVVVDPATAPEKSIDESRLGYPVPIEDTRMDAFDEVVVLRPPRYAHDPVAVSVQHAIKKRLVKVTVADRNVVVLADKHIGPRAYYTRGVVFDSYKKSKLKDEAGRIWQITEEYLVSPDGERLPRTPSHRCYWYAWSNLYPMTDLIK